MSNFGQGKSSELESDTPGNSLFTLAMPTDLLLRAAPSLARYKSRLDPEGVHIVSVMKMIRDEDAVELRVLMKFRGVAKARTAKGKARLSVFTRLAASVPMSEWK